MKKDQLKEELQEHLDSLPKSFGRIIEKNNSVVVEYPQLSKANRANDVLRKRGFEITPINEKNHFSPHQYRVVSFNPDDLEATDEKLTINNTELVESEPPSEHEMNEVGKKKKKKNTEEGDES